MKTFSVKIVENSQEVLELLHRITLTKAFGKFVGNTSWERRYEGNGEKSYFLVKIEIAELPTYKFYADASKTDKFTLMNLWERRER